MPKVFTENDKNKLLEIVEMSSLGTLVVTGVDGYEVNHLPFVVDRLSDDSLRLRAHLPKANPLCAELISAKKCVVVFNGPDGYITPSWYATKQQHGRAVPTWNYSVVHMHGTCNLVDDSAWIYEQLVDLTAKNERLRSDEWQVSDAPSEFIESQLRALMGLEVLVERIDGKVKASQNQPDINKETILSALNSEQPDSALNKMMQAELIKT